MGDYTETRKMVLIQLYLINDNLLKCPACSGILILQCNFDFYFLHFEFAVCPGFIFFCRYQTGKDIVILGESKKASMISFIFAATGFGLRL